MPCLTHTNVYKIHCRDELPIDLSHEHTSLRVPLPPPFSPEFWDFAPSGPKWRIVTIFCRKKEKKSLKQNNSKLVIASCHNILICVIAWELRCALSSTLWGINFIKTKGGDGGAARFWKLPASLPEKWFMRPNHSQRSLPVSEISRRPPEFYTVTSHQDG